MTSSNGTDKWYDRLKYYLNPKKILFDLNDTGKAWIYYFLFVIIIIVGSTLIFYHF